MIKEIGFLPNNYKFITLSNPDSTEISSLNKVNILVGPNNSGKSRFVRRLLLDNYNPEVVGSKSKGNSQEFNQVIQMFISNKNKYDKNFPKISGSISQIQNTLNKQNVDKRNQSLNRLFTNVDDLEDNQDRKRIYSELTEVMKHLDETYNKYIKFMNTRAVYIPVLRGLRPLVQVKSSTSIDNPTPYSKHDCYTERTIFDHFANPSIKDEITNMTANFFGQYNFEIFTGLNLYDEIKKMLLGDHEERNFVKEFEQFLQEKFFQNYTIALTPNISDDVLYIKIGEGEERPIYDLSDGLQTIIITTFPLFKYKKETLLLFVEEPELTLHPGMQRKLLETYCSNQYPNTQVFLTTHSNHLLDLTLDYQNSCSIYAFEKESDKEFQIKNVTPNRDVLELLGMRSSSVFLSNCVIWVEGVSDRLYIGEFLGLYMKDLDEKFEEDKHYSIIEYGGGNIVHFNFDIPDDEPGTINVDSITKNNFIVADNDGYDYEGEIRPREKEKSKRLKIYNDKFSPNVFTKHREIENLIPFKVFRSYFESIEDTGRKWRYNPEKGNQEKFEKNSNDKRIDELLKQSFIELKDTDDKPDYFDKKDITCIGKEKKDIAFEIIEVMNENNISFNDLPELAQEMTKNIYEFIKTNNSD